MPRYDYRCTICAHEFELLQSFSEAGSATCPVCSGSGRRLFHAVPVIYKGSGFYTTDYGRPKTKTDDSSKESTDGAKSTDESKAKATATDGKKDAGSGSEGATEAKSDSTTKAAKDTSS